MSDSQNANLEKGDKVAITADQTPATITEKLPEGDVGSASDPAVLVSQEGQEGVGQLKNASELTKVNEGGGKDVEMKDANTQGGAGEAVAGEGEDKTKDGKPAAVGEKRGISEVDDEGVESKRAKVDEPTSAAGADDEAQSQPPAENPPRNRRSSRIKKEVAPPPAKETTKKAAAAGGGKKRGPGRPKKAQGGEEVKGSEEKTGEENGVKGGGEAAEKANGHEGQNGHGHAEGANGEEAEPATTGAEPASVQVN
ncbi:hypothetical protein BJ165DRAFT_1490006 [Panaeolus papilionaceus]|nr:hypothetical protein BJ165DRAFT_1490006 [Panaeolus papilionaceus]